MGIPGCESSPPVLKASSGTLRRTLSKVLKPKGWGRSTRTTADLEPDTETNGGKEPAAEDHFEYPGSQDALGTIPNGAGPLGNGSRPSLDSTISPRHLRRSLEASTDALSIIDLMLQGSTPTTEQLVTIRTQLAKEQENWLNVAEDGWEKELLMQRVMAKVSFGPAKVRSLPHGTTPMVCLSPQLRMALARAMNWQQPIQEISVLSKGKPLTTIMMWIFDELALYDALGLDQIAVRRFANLVEQGYQGCPYHNNLHAASVTLTLFQILIASGLAKGPAAGRSVGQAPMQLHLFAAILAAAVHDLQHPGVGNDFREDEASQKYHDTSVNENDHLAHAFAAIRETDVLKGLDANAQRVVRSVIIDMVLKTDMSVHFDVVAKFKAAMGQGRKSSPEEMLSASLAMMLKCSDLGHSCLPWNDHLRWFRLLEEEFHQQGDMELKLGITPSALTNREKSMGLTQAKFFEALIIPLFRELAAVFPETGTMLKGAMANRDAWEANGGIVPPV